MLQQAVKTITLQTYVNETCFRHKDLALCISVASNEISRLQAAVRQLNDDTPAADKLFRAPFVL
jgi:hypothetical protein